MIAGAANSRWQNSYLCNHKFALTVDALAARFNVCLIIQLRRRKRIEPEKAQSDGEGKARIYVQYPDPSFPPSKPSLLLLQEVANQVALVDITGVDLDVELFIG
jgi:hypothetical protein